MVVVFVHFGKYNRRKVSKEDHICLSCVGVKIVNLDINIDMLLLYTLYLNCLKTRNKHHCFVHIVESVLYIIVSRNWSLFFFLTRLDVKASKENAYALLKSYSKLSLKYLLIFLSIKFFMLQFKGIQRPLTKVSNTSSNFHIPKRYGMQAFVPKKWQKKCSILNRSTF